LGMSKEGERKTKERGNLKSGAKARQRRVLQQLSRFTIPLIFDGGAQSIYSGHLPSLAMAQTARMGSALICSLALDLNQKARSELVTDTESHVAAKIETAGSARMLAIGCYRDANRLIHYLFDTSRFQVT
jgi:hypothetical protein